MVGDSVGQAVCLNVLAYRALNNYQIELLLAHVVLEGAVVIDELTCFEKAFHHFNQLPGDKLLVGAERFAYWTIHHQEIIIPVSRACRLID